MCALAGGNVFCWGSGAIGDGSYGQNGFAGPFSDVPVPATGALTGRTVTALADTTTNGSMCAIADGDLFCWGFAGAVTLDWDCIVNDTTPGWWVTEDTCIDDAESYFGGMGQSASALLSSGSAVLNKEFGHLQVVAPVAVPKSGAMAGATVTAVSTTGYHTCAVADGEAVCWGNNSQGQLGDGSTAPRISPAGAVGSALANRTVTSVTTGIGFTCAVADGEVFCWGANQSGQLGVGVFGGTFRTPTAVAAGVTTGRTVTSVTATSGYVLALY